MAVNDLIRLRKGTASEWASANPTLALGEPGYDSTNGILKIGNGITAWSGLSNHNHTSSNISDFNTAVSGLISVKDIVPGNNITVSSSSGTYTINSTASGGVTQILSYSTTASFPATGSTNSYYFASDSSRLYQWTGSQYVEIGSPTTTISANDPTVGLTLLHPFLLGGM